MRVCFIGHRTIEKKEELAFLLKETILTLINKNVTIFLFGSKSEFDDLAWKIVTELKATYPFIKRVYVRSTHQFIDKTYEEYLLKSYEETYFPLHIANAGKYSYIERNYEMINNSTFCVFYYNKNYVPQLKQNRKNKMLQQSSPNSGTKIAYNYALKKKKIIINLYK